MGDKEQTVISQQQQQQSLSQQAQDLFVCFNSDKDLRSFEIIQMKASMYTGMAIRVKKVNDASMENILYAIETSQIIHLRFEDTHLTKNAATFINEFLKNKSILESIGFNNVTYDDIGDHKKIFDGLTRNQKIKQVFLQQNIYDQAQFGDWFRQMIQSTRVIRELDLSWSEFRNPVIFNELAFGLNKEGTRIQTLKIRGFQVGVIEGKIIELIITGSKLLTQIDISQCFGSQENFVFLRKVNKLSNLRVLNMEDIKSDISDIMPIMGESLAQNTKLQILNMKLNKIKVQCQIIFWQNLLPNKTLKILNLEKTKMSDKVMPYLTEYLIQDEIQLEDLNISKNVISGKGLIIFSKAVSLNQSLKKLNLSQNEFQEEGLSSLSQSLYDNLTLEELWMNNCGMNNQGVINFSQFLDGQNYSLKYLDLSKNAFGDEGFSGLCASLKNNFGLLTLIIARNSEITDTQGLISLSDCLIYNKFLQTIDMTGIRIRKPCLKQHILPALQKNIFLQKFIGKIPPNIISEELQFNIIIEQEIIQNLKIQQADNQLWLNLQNKKIDVLMPAMKLIRHQELQNIDLTNMQIDDSIIRMISDYLCEDPPLKKLILNDNNFTDEGFQFIIESLHSNTQLTDLYIMRCQELTNDTLTQLYNVIKNVNMSLYNIQLEITQFDKDLAVDVMKESSLNKAIQKNLQPYKKQVTAELNTVSFNPDCKIVDYFESVVKCWRILTPNYINMCNEEIEDSHIQQMNEFLMNQSLIQQLILRRNNICDLGAEALAKFIEKNDKHFKHLELSRNQIKEKGALAILAALKNNTRITTLLIDFGNQITLKTCLKIEKEVQANHHIINYVRPSLISQNNEAFRKLSIQDKGPDFLRCAIKSVQLFKLLQLDLSDNLISYKETKQIITILNENYPLRSLNLSNNIMDPKCAVVLSKALQKNTNLMEINLSYNHIGDSGIATLIQPIAKCKLQLKQNEIEQSKLKKINFSSNKHSNEALKHVYALLFASREIIIEINDPNASKQNLMGSPKHKKNSIMPSTPGSRSPNRKKTFGRNESTSSLQSPSFQFKDKSKTKGLGRYAPRQLEYLKKAKKDRAKLYLSQPDPNETMNSLLNLKALNVAIDGDEMFFQNKDAIININDNDGFSQQVLQLQLNPIKKSKLNLQKFCWGKQTTNSKKNFLIRMYDDYLLNKKTATMFMCNENILTNVESISQRYVTAAIYLSIFGFYITSIIIPVTEEGECASGHDISTYIYYAIYMAFSFALELGLCIYIQKKVGDKKVLKINKFHLQKILTGQLGRLDFFTDTLFVVQLYKCELFLMMYCSLVCLFLCTLYSVFMVFRLMKKDNTLLLENIERNCKLAYISEHHALAIILDAFSLSNFESIGKTTITIPKIISMIKSFIEDLPQFILQVVYIFKYGESTGSTWAIVLSILLGGLSFGRSVHHAFTVKSSNVDSVKVMNKIEERLHQTFDIDIDIELLDNDDLNISKAQSVNNHRPPSSQNSTLQLDRITPQLLKPNSEQLKKTQILLPKVKIVKFDQKELQKKIEIKQAAKKKIEENKTQAMELVIKAFGGMKGQSNSSDGKVSFAQLFSVNKKQN